MSLHHLLGGPTDMVDIVVADTGTRTDLRVEADAKRAIVLSAVERGKRIRFTCDPATGAVIPEPADTSAPPQADALRVGGVTLSIREQHGKREIVRTLPDGWVEVLRDVGAEQVVWTDRYAFVVLHGHEHFTNKPSLFISSVGPSGPIVSLTMPTWLVSDANAFQTVALPQARAVVITSEKRAAWFTYDMIEKIHRIAPRMVKVRAQVPGTSGDGEVTVTRGGSSGAVVEGADGRRIMINKQRVPVATGERLTVTTINGIYALVNASGATVAREDKIEMVRTVDAKAAKFEHYDTVISAADSKGSVARERVANHVRRRLQGLAKLGLAPNLDDRAIDDAAIALWGPHDYVPKRGGIAAAGLLHEHLRSHPLPPERALMLAEDSKRSDADPIVAASRGNHELAASGASRRWHLVMMPDYEPFALCLEPKEHSTIVAGELLFFEPVPAYKPLPDTAEAARAELLALLAIEDADLACKAGKKKGRHELRFSTRGAAWLENKLRHDNE